MAAPTPTAIPVLPPHRTGMLARPGGVRLHWELTGEGPPIVFAHGLGGNHLSWWRQVATFAPRHACVAFAARGFAPSSPVDGGPDPRDFADDLAALIDALGLARPVLVAQSMGGWGAVELALRAPGRLRGLVLAATTGTIDPAGPGGVPRPRLDAWARDAQATLQAWAHACIHPAVGARMAAEQPAAAHLYRAIDAMAVGLDKHALRGRLMAARTRAPTELAAVGCPVLFVVGDEDPVIPPFAADAIAPHVPGARVVHLPDAGHSAYFERPEAFEAAVRGFVDALPA
jgi:pimeloyl-ACP methyl ester carboxylesterase